MNRAMLIGFSAILNFVAAVGCQSSGGPTAVSQASPIPARPATTSPAATTSTSPSPTTPSSQQSAVATAERARAPESPVEFTGRIVCGPPVRTDQEETLSVGAGGTTVSRYRNGAWRQTVTMSDERLQGTIYETFESDTYTLPAAGTGAEMWSATHRIENDSGAWESKAIGGNFSDGTIIGADGPDVWIGEGAYEGLVAVMDSTPIEDDCVSDVRGLIFDTGPLSGPYAPD